MATVESSQAHLRIAELEHSLLKTQQILKIILLLMEKPCFYIFSCAPSFITWSHLAYICLNFCSQVKFAFAKSFPFNPSCSLNPASLISLVNAQQKSRFIASIFWFVSIKIPQSCSFNIELKLVSNATMGTAYAIASSNTLPLVSLKLEEQKYPLSYKLPKFDSKVYFPIGLYDLQQHYFLFSFQYFLDLLHLHIYPIPKTDHLAYNLKHRLKCNSFFFDKPSDKNYFAGLIISFKIINISILFSQSQFRQQFNTFSNYFFYLNLCFLINTVNSLILFDGISIKWIP